MQAFKDYLLPFDLLNMISTDTLRKHDVYKDIVVYQRKKDQMNRDKGNRQILNSIHKHEDTNTKAHIEILSLCSCENQLSCIGENDMES